MKQKIFLTLALVMLLMVDSGISRVPATTFESDPDLSLLETGQATKVRRGAPVPSELKIISYNIRWRGGEDLKKPQKSPSMVQRRTFFHRRPT